MKNILVYILALVFIAIAIASFLVEQYIPAIIIILSTIGTVSVLLKRSGKHDKSA